MAPPRASEWTYVGVEEANLERTLKDCESRTNESDFYNYGYTESVALYIVAEVVVPKVRSDKYFVECMNGRGFAKVGDANRLGKEIQEDNEAKERYMDERRQAAKIVLVEVGGYVAAKYSMLVIYKQKSTDSDRVATATPHETAKVLSIEEDWTKVELNHQVGWVRSGAIKVRSGPTNSNSWMSIPASVGDESHLTRSKNNEKTTP